MWSKILSTLPQTEYTWSASSAKENLTATLPQTEHTWLASSAKRKFSCPAHKAKEYAARHRPVQPFEFASSGHVMRVLIQQHGNDEPFQKKETGDERTAQG